MRRSKILRRMAFFNIPAVTVYWQLAFFTKLSNVRLSWITWASVSLWGLPGFCLGTCCARRWASRKDSIAWALNILKLVFCLIIFTSAAGPHVEALAQFHCYSSLHAVSEFSVRRMIFYKEDFVALGPFWNKFKIWAPLGSNRTTNISNCVSIQRLAPMRVHQQ